VFYIRKPIKAAVISVLREATSTELYNYKNRFVIVPPVDDPVPSPEIKPGCACGHPSNCFDEMSFININCDLDLDILGAKS
jgi:hypothetical protein